MPDVHVAVFVWPWNITTEKSHLFVNLTISHAIQYRKGDKGEWTFKSQRLTVAENSGWRCMAILPNGISGHEPVLYRSIMTADASTITSPSHLDSERIHVRERSSKFIIRQKTNQCPLSRHANAERSVFSAQRPCAGVVS